MKLRGTWGRSISNIERVIPQLENFSNMIGHFLNTPMQASAR